MLSDRQLEIYNNVLALTKEGDSFYFVDQILEGITYRVFAYRLASYTEFMKPDAVEARGLMFQMDGETPVRLACRTPHKFFNLNENPTTIGLDTSFENVKFVMDKVDGSLISSYLDHNDKLRLKSKTSLSSDQVRFAEEYLHDNKNLYRNVREMAQNGQTVNMEYTGPNNRIVIGYEKPNLTVLSIRDNDSGMYHDWLYNVWPGDMFYGNTVVMHPNAYDIAAMKDAQGFEGVVVVLKNGVWFKHKTAWYLALHKTKDSINSKRKLFECVITEATDDLKAMFFEDPVAMKLIVDMEALVVQKYHLFVAHVEGFYLNNKDLDRKSYAIKGQQEMPRELFGLAMSKYLGREIDYKEWAIKHYEMFGVKDEVMNVTADTKE